MIIAVQSYAKKMSMRNFKGIIYAVVSSATFGLIPLFSIPLLQAGMASPAILFYRMLLSAAMMGLMALLTHRNLRISGRDAAVLGLLAAMYAATSLGLLRSYDYIPSGWPRPSIFSIRWWWPIVMTLFFHERSSVWIVVAIFISLMGVPCWRGARPAQGSPHAGLARQE